MIVAGDIGGTKCNLGLFEIEGGAPRLLREESYASADFHGLAPVLAAFLQTVGAPATRVHGACFGVAGPVLENRTSTPNLAWEIDGTNVAAESGVPAVVLINDLVATAEGIPLLAEHELATLHAGETGAGVQGNRVLLAAGTGLGMAMLPEIGGVHVPVPSEGGHADFAPRDDDEIGLLRYLRPRFGRISVERVVAGPGLHHLYEYLRDGGYAEESPTVKEALREGDPGKVISSAAEKGECALCVRALHLFVSAYGAVAGNLALLGTATGGVYLGGGIAPKILPSLKAGAFLESFLDKGRFRPFLARIPVRVLLNPRTAVLGAARRALAFVAL